ncbi:hypothetical protein OF83DRAFT_1091155 [Amylostereum chailletii]|nr:hypothetical protein OF83DRAFT_1091155 [Amylostereum chailletii]
MRYIDLDDPKTTSAPSESESISLPYGPGSVISGLPDEYVDRLVSLLEPSIERFCHLRDQETASQLAQLNEQHAAELAEHSRREERVKTQAKELEAEVTKLKLKNKEMEVSYSEMREMNWNTLKRDLEHGQDVYAANTELHPPYEPDTPVSAGILSPLLEPGFFDLLPDPDAQETDILEAVATTHPEPIIADTHLDMSFPVTPCHAEAQAGLGHTPSQSAHSPQALRPHSPPLCQCKHLQTKLDSAVKENNALRSSNTSLTERTAAQRKEVDELCQELDAAKKKSSECAKLLQAEREAAQEPRHKSHQKQVEHLMGKIAELQNANSTPRIKLLIPPSISAPVGRSSKKGLSKGAQRTLSRSRTLATDEERSTGSETEKSEPVRRRDGE